MNKVMNILKNDVKNISKNWVAAVIICGLIILPSLYAWFNIRASWDPYSQTNQIPVGVVNEDVGAKVRDQVIHVGDELVDTLKSNESFHWHFVDYETAMDNVYYGDFYAVIVIPENFSENLSTVIKHHPKKATVNYYVNEKINAISPKITEKGASVIVEQISNNFVSTVNGVIFKVFNDIGLEIEEELPDIEKIEQYIFTIEDKLPSIHETLTQSLNDAGYALNIVQTVKGELPKAQELSEDGLQAIKKTITFLSDAEKRINEMTPIIKEDIDKIEQNLNDMNKLIENIQSADLEAGLLKEIEKIEQSIHHTNQTIEDIIEVLNDFDDSATVENKNIQQAIDQLTNLNHELSTLEKNLQTIDSFFKDNEAEMNNFVQSIKEKSNNIHEHSNEIIHYYQETIEPTLFSSIDDIRTKLINAEKMIEEVQEKIPEIEQLLNRTEKTLTDGEGTIIDVIDEYPFINEKITELADRIRNLKKEVDIDEVIDLLKNDPEAEKGFFAEPVVLQENRVFPVQNYGTGMTPFYTVLATWVGAVLLISLLSVNIQQSELYSVRNIYFGRMLTFLTIAMLQTLIVTIGDITFIGVHASAPIWFVIFGLMISVVFMIIIYTVVSVFGDVGKAIAIIMLVLQIAGSGGTYPVVLLPEFFQFINPFLPFTYAVDLMREAVGGIVWSRAIKNIIVLTIMAILFILFAVFAKEPFNKRSQKLMEKSKEAGLFH